VSKRQDTMEKVLIETDEKKLYDEVAEDLDAEFRLK